jgi:Uma2 family endonuclease
VWSIQNGTGKAFGSSVEFFLPDGSALSPDAAWVSNSRLATLSKEQRRQFPRLVPEFVVEVLSPSDRLANARKKMRVWIANGVDLGWVIDGDERCVYIFRKDGQEEVVRDAERIAGEGPVEGFVLELREIWEGL